VGGGRKHSDVGIRNRLPFNAPQSGPFPGAPLLINWRYEDRGTLVQSLDPRARILLMLCMLGALVQVWDLRWLAGLFALAAAQYALARLSFRETARFWIFAGFIAIALTVFTALSGQSPAGYPARSWIHLGPVTLTWAQLWYALSQLIRILAISLLAIVIPFTINPSLYGVTFRGLGMSDKMAFAMDLSFRFVPSLASEFAGAMDAQKARGFELDFGRGSPVKKIRRMAPLIVPVTINAIVGAEEMVDAMELRGFGTGPRTWYSELTWRRRDCIVLLVSAVLFLGATGAHIAGITGLWVPGRG